MRLLPVLAAGIGLLLVTPRLEASPVILDFEGFKNIPPVFNSKGDIVVMGEGEKIDGAYSGGVGSRGTKAANLGVRFDSNAEVLNDIDAGGAGAFANNPSGIGVLYFLNPAEQPNSTIMNVAKGFTSSLSFSYTSIDLAGAATIYSGLNGTGTILASIVLPELGGVHGPGKFDNFTRWSEVSTTFSGVGQSVVFGGVANEIGFDDIKLNTVTPVPEPGSFVLLGSGLTMGIGLIRRRYGRG